VALVACVLALCCSCILKLSATPLEGQEGGGMGGGMGVLQGLVGIEAVLPGGEAGGVGGADGADFDAGDFEEGLAGLVDSAEERGMSMGAVGNANAALGAWAVLLMWFRQLRLLMIVSTDMAPLIRMMGGMIKDVINFLQLLILVLLGFAGALTTLFATDRSYRQLEPGSDCLQLMGPASSFGSVLKILFEGSLLGDSPFIACVSESEHPVTGLALAYGFILFSVVLLLNMIIAMMSKTFDRYYDSATQEAAAQFAGIVQDWEGETNLPAPFNIASIPYWALRALGLFAWCDKGSSTSAGAQAGASYKGASYKGASFEGLKSDELPAAADGENKGLRILRLGDQPGGTADLEELKDSIADKLQTQFGDHEDTGTLIDHAVKVLQRIQQLELALTLTPTPTPTATLTLSRCCRRAWRPSMKSRWPRRRAPWPRVVATAT
jgi:hypothetical protein